MSWQDFLITIVSIFFSYALIPQIIEGFKEKKAKINIQTGLINSIGMYTLVIAYISLGYILSTIVGLITATAWLTLFIQSVKYKK